MEKRHRNQIANLIDWVFIIVALLIYLSTLTVNDNTFHQTGSICLAISSCLSCINHYFFQHPSWRKFNIQYKYRDKFLANFKNNILTIFTVGIIIFFNNTGYNFYPHENLSYSLFLTYNSVFLYIIFVYIICQIIPNTQKIKSQIAQIKNINLTPKQPYKTSIDTVSLNRFPLQCQTGFVLIILCALSIPFSKWIFDMKAMSYLFILIQFYTFRYLLKNTASIAAWNIKTQSESQPIRSLL